MKYMVFCTAAVDLMPARYQDWIDYYSDFFAHTDTQLYLLNDGPVSQTLRLRGCRLIAFPEQWGRVSVRNFPGWRRSFAAGLKIAEYLRDTCRIAGAAHIESDCYVRKAARQKLFDAMQAGRYSTGFDALNRWPETALQVFDLKNMDHLRLYADDVSGTMVPEEYAAQLKPVLAFKGARIEGDRSRYRQEHDYVAQTTYKEFQLLTE